jgi:hypothetical protein
VFIIGLVNFKVKEALRINSSDRGKSSFIMTSVRREVQIDQKNKCRSMCLENLIISARIKSRIWKHMSRRFTLITLD